ncbi:MAG TPA: 1-deoxy-D-xylulose-5-phosphate reductoisomerase [Deltaproteobacteria bacterium]|nr:1-deoxy-D-xylulose-5-phosphate reductoisomerase [Deltaproteobacteria bacterium]HPP80625.1 1-deoxy-D-xylulose-5-phosphate reductoisomerase [Deltaproteobacteria bacterium]
MKRVAVLGSTGSIGESALDVIRMRPDRFVLVGLASGGNVERILEQALAFGVEIVGLARPKGPIPPGIEVITGENAASEVLRRSRPDIVVNGITGASGFLPSLEAVRMGSVLALANKESLVVGGKFLTEEAAAHGSVIVPVDSEHSAVFQCLSGEPREAVRRIVLTASGGPFRDRPRETFGAITPQEALNHPTWRMGRRITVDSATLMNKGLEMIEACWLFGVSMDMVEVVVHPQSIVHSMVEFSDSSIKAQLGLPDMRTAIAYALSWPDRLDLPLGRLSFRAPLALEFLPPDEEKFPALSVAKKAMERPEVLPCVMNAADEVAVEAFLSGRIRFDEIVALVKKTMDMFGAFKVETPDELVELDRQARKALEAMLA